MLVLLLIISSSRVCAMEKYTGSFESFLSLICSRVASQESSVIKVAREDKDNFEHKLLMPPIARKKYPDQVPIAWTYFPANRDIEYWYFDLLLGGFYQSITDDPAMFLYYCYYQKHHKDSSMNFVELTVSTDLLNQCKQAIIDGYSALGAAIIAKDIVDASKRDFIQQLIDFDFTFTQKDKVLAELMLYDSISAKHKKTMILLLCNDQTSNFSVLPYDVKKSLIYCMLRSYYEVSFVPFFNKYHY